MEGLVSDALADSGTFTQMPEYGSLRLKLLPVLDR